MTLRLRLTITAFWCVTAPSLTVAQAGVDVSTGELRFRGQPRNTAVIVAPQLTTAGAGLRVWTAGEFALASTGGSRSTLQSALTTRAPLVLGFSPMLTVRGQDDPLAGTGRNRRIDGAIGVSIGSPQFGAAATLGAARSTHGTTDRRVQTSNVDVHLARGAFQLRLGYTGTAFDAPIAASVTSGGFSLARTRLSDLTSNASWKHRGFEMGGFVGRRLGGHDENGRVWGGGFASLSISDRVAIVARQETAPADPTRHLAAQRYSTIGFRIRPSLTRARFDDGSTAAQFRREFVMTRIRGDNHGIRVYVPNASTVELAGSFNGWTPAAMRHAGGGWWELVIALPSGLHSLNVRADGGSWTVPPGLEAVQDEFTGTVGVLLIP